MNRFLSISLGTMALLAVSLAGAANPDPSRSAPVPPQPTPDATMQPTPDTNNGAVTDGAQSGAELTAKDRVYLVALKKCEPLEGSQRQSCIDAARKKAGQM
ncbi:MAG: hypothetical protein ABI771_16120 [Betaproteobacteria bacterium]